MFLLLLWHQCPCHNTSHILGVLLFLWGLHLCPGTLTICFSALILASVFLPTISVFSPQCSNIFKILLSLDTSCIHLKGLPFPFLKINVTKAASPPQLPHNILTCLFPCNTNFYSECKQCAFLWRTHLQHKYTSDYSSGFYSRNPEPAIFPLFNFTFGN